MAGTQAGIFRTATGLCIVDSPTRRKILDMLREGEMAFEEIVERVGRAKSTTSVHLRDLVDDGVLVSRLDSGDRRRKYFSIDAEYLGRISDTERVAENLAGFFSGFDPFDLDPVAFYRAVLRSIRVTLLADGISIDPVLTAAGKAIGEGLARAFEGMPLPEMLEGLAGFWERNGLGCLEVPSTAPLELVVYDCFECVDLPFLGRPACSFEEGLLTATFAGHFPGSAPVVRETACYAMGSGCCRFVIEPAPRVAPGAAVRA